MKIGNIPKEFVQLEPGKRYTWFEICMYPPYMFAKGFFLRPYLSFGSIKYNPEKEAQEGFARTFVSPHSLTIAID